MENGTRTVDPHESCINEKQLKVSFEACLTALNQVVKDLLRAPSKSTRRLRYLDALRTLVAKSLSVRYILFTRNHGELLKCVARICLGMNSVNCDGIYLLGISFDRKIVDLAPSTRNPRVEEKYLRLLRLWKDKYAHMHPYISLIYAHVHIYIKRRDKGPGLNNQSSHYDKDWVEYQFQLSRYKWLYEVVCSTQLEIIQVQENLKDNYYETSDNTLQYHRLRTIKKNLRKWTSEIELALSGIENIDPSDEQLSALPMSYEDFLSQNRSMISAYQDLLVKLEDAQRNIAPYKILELEKCDPSGNFEEIDLIPESVGE